MNEESKYELAINFTFKFDGEIDPQFMQEVVEWAEFLVPAMAKKEVERNSGDERWIKNAEVFAKILRDISASIGGSM
jgi:hypothetical protein